MRTIVSEHVAQPAEVARACELLEAACVAEGLEADATFRARLALEELASNVVRHQPAPARFRLRAEVWPAVAAVELTDWGTAFDPTRQPPPALDLPPEQRPIGGLGLELVRANVEHLRYARGVSTNCVSFVVHPRGPSGPKDTGDSHHGP